MVAFDSSTGNAQYTDDYAATAWASAGTPSDGAGTFEHGAFFDGEWHITEARAGNDRILSSSDLSSYAAFDMGAQTATGHHAASPGHLVVVGGAPTVSAGATYSVRTAGAGWTSHATPPQLTGLTGAGQLRVAYNAALGVWWMAALTISSGGSSIIVESADPTASSWATVYNGPLRFRHMAAFSRGFVLSGHVLSPDGTVIQPALWFAAYEEQGLMLRRVPYVAPRANFTAGEATAAPMQIMPFGSCYITARAVNSSPDDNRIELAYSAHDPYLIVPE